MKRPTRLDALACLQLKQRMTAQLKNSSGRPSPAHKPDAAAGDAAPAGEKRREPSPAELRMERV